MEKLQMIGLGFAAIVCLVMSLMGFMGKDMILDPAYTKASGEAREKMDKAAYRRQSAIIFLFLFGMSLCNFLRIPLHASWLSYVSIALFVAGALYAVTSHKKLQEKQS